jgi:hypothetical protein
LLTTFDVLLLPEEEDADVRCFICSGGREMLILFFNSISMFIFSIHSCASFTDSARSRISTLLFNNTPFPSIDTLPHLMKFVEAIDDDDDGVEDILLDLFLDGCLLEGVTVNTIS